MRISCNTPATLVGGQVIVNKTLPTRFRTQKVTWRAQISDTELVDEESNHIKATQSHLKQKQVLKVWPEWGTLEPGETAGAQLFLCSDLLGKTAATVEIRLDQNPDFILYIPVFAETQAPYLILKNALVDLQSLRTSVVPSDCAAVTLQNPTAFNVAYAWCEAIGTDIKFCQVKLQPSSGFVAPRGSIECKLIATGIKPGVLRNLFVPCCVDGMKEPLLIQINGVVKESKNKWGMGMYRYRYRPGVGAMEDAKEFYMKCLDGGRHRHKEARRQVNLGVVGGEDEDGGEEELVHQNYYYPGKLEMKLKPWKQRNAYKTFVMPICPKIAAPPPPPKWKF